MIQSFLKEIIDDKRGAVFPFLWDMIELFIQISGQTVSVPYLHKGVYIFQCLSTNLGRLISRM